MRHFTVTGTGLTSSIAATQSATSVGPLHQHRAKTTRLHPVRGTADIQVDLVIAIWGCDRTACASSAGCEPPSCSATGCSVPNSPEGGRGGHGSPQGPSPFGIKHRPPGHIAGENSGQWRSSARSVPLGQQIGPEMDSLSFFLRGLKSLSGPPAAIPTLAVRPFLPHCAVGHRMASIGFWQIPGGEQRFMQQTSDGRTMRFEGPV